LGWPFLFQSFYFATFQTDKKKPPEQAAKGKSDQFSSECTDYPHLPPEQ
jgi:hypothetical protein